MDGLIDFIQKSSVTDWIQAMGSIVALFIAYVSLVISKRSLDTGVRTQLRVTKVTFSRERFPSTEFVVMITNSGRNDAFEISVDGHFFENFSRVELKGKGYKFYDYTKNRLIGNIEIKSGETGTYSLSRDSHFAFDYKSPLILRYELASGTVVKHYWKVNTGGSNIKGMFIKMSPFEIIKFKVYRIWTEIKHPFVITYKYFVMKKQSPI